MLNHLKFPILLVLQHPIVGSIRKRNWSNQYFYLILENAEIKLNATNKLNQNPQRSLTFPDKRSPHIILGTFPWHKWHHTKNTHEADLHSSPVAQTFKQNVRKWRLTFWIVYLSNKIYSTNNLYYLAYNNITQKLSIIQAVGLVNREFGNKITLSHILEVF